jgi:hypothetical protein
LKHLRLPNGLAECACVTIRLRGLLAVMRKLCNAVAMAEGSRPSSTD